jgi:lysylphosphatidylglycerol synthetase-like protein (DUF2156 family)
VRRITRYPTTATFVIAAAILGLVAGVLPGPISYVFISNDPLRYISDLVIAAFLLGIGERLMGSVRSALVFVIAGPIGVYLGYWIQQLLFATGDFWSLGDSPTELFDPVAPALVVALTGSAFATLLWRRRIRVVVIVLAILFGSYATVPTDIYRLTAALFGLLLGILLVRQGAHRTIDLSPRASRRRFIAGLSAATALGPLLAMLRPSGLSPLALLSSIATGETIDTAAVLETCGLGSSWACERGLLVISNHGVGTSALSFVPLVLILLASWGMWRGRRFAMWLAIVVDVLLSLIAALTLNIPAVIDSVINHGRTIALPEFTLAVFLAVALPLTVSIVIFANREVFPVKANRKDLRLFWVSVGVSFGVLYTAILSWSLVMVHPTNVATTPWFYLGGSLKRFLPGRLLDQPRGLSAGQDLFGNILFQSVGPIFWVLFIAFAARLLLKPEPVVHETRRDRAFDLIKRGGSSLAYMGMWQGNNYWFSSDHEALVVYRVINGIALTLSDVVCLPGEELRRIHEFTSFCDRNHWVPVFYSVHENMLESFTSLGWQVSPVGQESRLLLSEIDMSSKEWQKIRHAHNRAGREEVTAVWTSWPQLSAEQQRQVSSIAQGWASNRDIPEMGFTLGTERELRDPNIGLMLAIDTAGKIHGITSWLPVYRNGDIIGWTLDFMRRSGDAFPGVMEFLIGSAAIMMKDQGLESISLSGVPLAKRPQDAEESPAQEGVLDRLQSFLAKRLEPAYGFESLMFFKSKFHPHYETLYMAYADPVALPNIARAIGRAYLPDVTTRGALRLLWRLRHNTTTSSN